MSRKKIVVGNWKMHGSLDLVSNLTEQICASLKPSQDREVVLCPPYPYLLPVAQHIGATDACTLGSQNVSTHSGGAMTGEVSSSMLADCGCKYVIIGHSERRESHHEQAGVLIAKMNRVLESNLIPVLCIGEPAYVREQGTQDSYNFLKDQLVAVLEPLSHQLHAEIVIAYEPIWAIGTGVVATSDVIWQTHDWIKHCLKEHGLSDTAVLYGGSVKAGNAQQILGLDNVDGVLVGGASLNAAEFVKICEAAAVFA